MSKSIQQCTNEFNEICKTNKCSKCTIGKHYPNCGYGYMYEQGKADAIDEFYETKTEVLGWLLERQGEGYGTTLGELLDYIYDYKLKEQKE